MTMRRLKRDTEVLPIIAKYMANVCYEDQINATADLWALFDGLHQLFLELEKDGWFERDKPEESGSLNDGGSLTTKII